jgi:hypothetical protein
MRYPKAALCDEGSAWWTGIGQSVQLSAHMCGLLPGLSTVVDGLAEARNGFRIRQCKAAH